MYAVDVGVGQLLGRLRVDLRVVNLEGTNLAHLSPHLVPDPVDLLTLDLSYLALADAIPHLDGLRISRDADLVMLVKPTFELRRGTLAATPGDVAEATGRAARAAERADWQVTKTCAAPATGQHGAHETFIHARRPK